MTREDAKDYLSALWGSDSVSVDETIALEMAIKALEQEQKTDGEMTTEEYRQRMIKAFQNAGCGELIALCVLPTEQDFEFLEWLLKNHYKQEPKTDILGKIRAEIESKYGQRDICEYFENYDCEENDISEYRPIGNISDVLQIIDKYRGE